jgi:hypothetical protein
VKPTVNQKIDDVLDIAPEDVTTTELVPVEPAEIVSSGNDLKDRQDDMQRALSAMRHVLETALDLSDNATFVAKEKQDAKTYEAASLALKEARETALALGGVWKAKQDLEQQDKPAQSGDVHVTNNAVFVGTTGELLKFAKETRANQLNSGAEPENN